MTDADNQPPIALESYEALAERYDRFAPNKAHNAHYERPATLALLPDVKGKRVLDAGCGPGIVSAWLLDHGAVVEAFDISPRMIEYYRQRNGDHAPVRLANLEEPLDFLADARFDVVVSSLVLDYVRDWRPTFAEFQRVLKQGGVLVVSMMHPAADYFVYHSSGSYFDVEAVVETWKFGGEDVEMRRYRHPLGHLFEALGGAGLVLDRFVEPRPIESFREQEPEEYEVLMRRPGFLCVRAVKGGEAGLPNH